MIYRNLYIQLIVRVILITITCFIFSFEFLRTDHTFTLINLGLLIVLQVVILVRFLNKTNKNLSAFFDSIKSGDQADVLSEYSQSSSLKELNHCLNEINKSIQKVKIENQVQWEFP